MTKKLLYYELTWKIIGAALEVHKILGPGFLEAVYEDALCIELDRCNIKYQRQVELKINYKKTTLKPRYRADLFIEDKIIVDNKATTGLTDVDKAQLFNYLKATKMKVGLLINFGTKSLEWKRFICDYYFNSEE